MHTVTKKLSLTALLLTLPCSVFAWNALGHMVVANIAYQHLQPSTREKVDGLVAKLNEQYHDMTTFQHVAYWPDLLRLQKIETYTHWHYIDVAFSNDGTPLKNIVDTDNAVWALENIKKVVKNARANPYERSRFLAFMTHIVGDMHQPLHTVSYLSAERPDGDNGGNLYTVIYNNKRVNLHKLWDSGLEAFAGETSTAHASIVANAIMARFPSAYFGDQINDLSPDNWAKEGMADAKKYVYAIPEHQSVTADYLDAGKQIAERNAALAGYRLAALLNQLLG